MHAFVEVIGPGSADSSSSIQLFFDEARYLFECGDGTQRLCTEYGIKLGRLRGIYLTSLAAPSAGGLFGLFLTIADAGKQKLYVAGPDGLKRLFNVARCFYRRPTLEKELEEINIETPADLCPIQVTKDENVTIQAVPVKTKRNIEVDTSFGAHYDCLTYVCRMRDIRGKFNPKRAMELGVKRGKNFGILQKGGSVILDDGTVVKSCDVMSPSTPGPLLIVAACPTLDHIESLTTAKALDPVELGVLQSDGSGEAVRTTLICHLAPKEVLCNQLYQQWCDSFGSTVSHLPLHHSVSSRRTVFASQAEDLALLHQSIDKELFPLPADCYTPNYSLGIAALGEDYKQETGSLTPTAPIIPTKVRDSEPSKTLLTSRVGKWMDSDCRLKFILSPPSHKGPERSAVRPRYLTPNPVEQRPWRDVSSPYNGEPMPDSPELETPSCMSALPPHTTAVRFFGTGAAIPGKHRNVSSVMLDMFERGGLLFDCGEGTWGQMVRHFGMERAQRVLCTMKVIFISHMHADHHLGLLTVLHERTKALQAHQDLKHGPQLVIIGPVLLESWLEAFQEVAKVPLRDRIPSIRRSYTFRDARSLTDPQTHDTSFFTDSFGIRIGCVAVDHCPLSYGIVIQDTLREWKVVYSGDTRPCEALAKAGRDATLAIHEATLEDELASEAVEKMHCTTSEAVEVCAFNMRAWRTILTHFSQRYPKIPRLDDKILRKLYEGRAAVAFDLMCVDFVRLQDLPRIMLALRETFPDEVSENMPEVSIPVISQ